MISISDGMYQKHWAWKSRNARRASRTRTMSRASSLDRCRRLFRPPLRPISDNQALTFAGGLSIIGETYRKLLMLSKAGPAPSASARFDLPPGNGITMIREGKAMAARLDRAEEVPGLASREWTDKAPARGHGPRGGRHRAEPLGLTDLSAGRSPPAPQRRVGVRRRP